MRLNSAWQWCPSLLGIKNSENSRVQWIASSIIFIVALCSFQTKAWSVIMGSPTFRSKGVTYNRSGEVVDCLFCRIHRGEEPATIVMENSDVVVFKTIKPYSHTHLLATPRRHIRNTDSLLGHSGAQVVRQLVAAGQEALGPQYAADALYCFHMPPFNSIDHLHLHVIASPASMRYFGAQKYNTRMFYCKSADSIIAALERQDRNVSSKEQKK